MIQKTDTDLKALIDVIPARIKDALLSHPNIDELLEVVLDLGRHPEARFLGENELLDIDEVTEADIDFAIG